jgi:receptor protein-tyrosine kinase
LLGTIPSIDALKDKRLSPTSLVLSSDPRSSSAEAFRVARTGIAFSRIDDPPRRLLVTSTAQGEGKSTFAGNIACAYAESGKSTILVDLDLRRPSLSSLAPGRAPGFTNLLLDPDGDPETYLVPGPVPGLQIFPTGPLPPSPAEVISSHRMTEIIQRLHSLADVIVIDSPPILAAADAAITASHCDGVVLLVRPDRVTRRTVMRAVETLRTVGVPLVGLVVNGVPRSDNRYYSYGYYYDYYRPGGKDKRSDRPPVSPDKKRKRIEEAADQIGT